MSQGGSVFYQERLSCVCPCPFHFFKDVLDRPNPSLEGSVGCPDVLRVDMLAYKIHPVLDWRSEFVTVLGAGPNMK